ncbi:nuclear pore complex protein Nup214 isoform X2 [Lucilia sericata]|uniref:nuclear pore complex protein Nup214 isoform X2 n=1 Tax=Lucilia sericata TaxID=13632 RepID=UPI0018A83878|nr:nuclear pore complex protein Nup214 isoform X2 [Lucilia sericata]
MAQNAPPSQDVQDIQFKLHDKFSIFSEAKDVKSLVSLLAVSSAKGLLFAGNPHSNELKVFKLRDIVDAKASGQELKVRVVNLPGEPKVLACSCDGSMLAVNYVLNNTGFLQIYQVDSFVTPTPTSMYNMPVAPESNVFALQMLWNPVIPNNIALILTDGSVAMFTLNNGQYDKVTLGKEHQVKAGCWSPKGKQIVFGFAEGKLQQFKPNLQPARAIPCPPGIHPGPFDCIAVHWLSTFQFAAIFLQRGQEMCPSLFIVNAPKAGQPSYINYYDVCYSAPGPRIQQLSFNHIAPWNLLLVTSANGVEVGVLGTKDAGDNPNWIQYTLLDEARIEMPLTESKDETYPLGFAYDTASSHQVLVGEKKLPVMPMIHVLSTHGHLVSYNFLNLAPNAVDVCSPPPPLNDISGQFVDLKQTVAVAASQARPQGGENKPPTAGQGFGDMTFSIGSNMVTSTPAIKDKPVPLFGTQPAAAKPTTGFGFNTNAPTASSATTAPTNNKPSTGFGFGSATTTTTSTAQPFSQPFGGAMTTGTPFGGFSGTGFTAKPNEAPKQPTTQTQTSQLANLNKNPEANKPLYTVPATFTPPSVQQTQNNIKSEQKTIQPAATSNKMNLNTGEIDEVVKQMIVIQIEAFEMEFKHIRQQSKQLMENIGSPDEIKSYSKQLNDLQEILEQANDHEFEQDVQSLRHSMNESYAMLAECRTKLDLYNNPNLTRLSTVSSTDPTSRRQLAKLQAYAASNQNQLSQLNQLIDAQWSQYQDVVRRNSKNQMHIPCLDGIYQRMSKLKDMLARQRTKMNYIKTKLKQKGLNYKPPSEVDVTSVAVGALTKNQSTMESLADSILSMSLSQVVSQTQAKLSEDKLNAIRNFTKRQQQIAIIKPKRPDRIGLKSEVILETKLETERKQKEMVKKQQQQQQMQQQIQQQQQMQQQQYMQQQQQQYIQQQQQQQQYAAYKQQTNMQKVVASKPHEQQNYQTQLQQQLLKPQATISTPQQQQPPLLAKPTASKPNIVSSQPPTFITPTSSAAATLSFGGNSSFVKTSNSTTATKTDESNKPIATSTAFTGFGMTTSQQQTSLSFNQTKPLLNTAATSMANESKENQQPTNTPISFSAKVIGGNDAKPFTNLGNKTTTQTNAVQPPAQGFAASTSSGFSAFANTKPLTQTSNQTKDDTKKLEETPKQFGFSTASSTTTTSTSSSTSIAPPAAFGGFGGSTKPATTAAPFSTSLFGSNSSTNTSTPFATLSSSSSFSFNANVSTTAATPASTKAVTTTTITTSSTPAATAVTAKPAEIKTPQITTASSASSAPTSSAPASFISPAAGNTTVTSTKSTAAPNVTITSTGLPEPKPAATATPTSSSTPTPSATADPTDSLFGSLNICKPTAKEAAGDSGKPANIFSGFAAATSTASSGAFSFVSASGAGDGAKSFLGSTSTTGTTPSTGFSFVSAASATPATTANLFGKPATAETTAAATGTTTTTTLTTTSTAVSSTAAAPSNAATTSSFTFAAAAAPAAASTAGSLFGSLSLSSSTAVSTTAATATTTSAPAAGNIFGGGSSVFGQTSTAATTSTTTSIFGGGAAAASSAPSLFGSTAPATTTAATPGSGSIFGAAAAATPPAGGSVFGGIPKPDQSVFGAANTAAQPAGTGLFAAAAAATKPPAATGGSIFGGGSSTGFGGSTAGSIFGGGGNTAAASPFSSTASANTAGSIFGAAAAATKPAEGGSIFGSPTQQSASSGGSLFGKSTFGATAAPQSAGGIFGGAAAQSPTSGGFGASGGSIFGGSAAANTSASGGSIFGQAAAATAPAFGASPGFGSFSQPSSAPAFGSPSAGGFGAPAATGFGSPQQQGAFAKPVFGGPASFGSPQPAFGAQPTFGGAPTFGSPKGFGSFAATSPTATGFGAGAQASAAPKGNIFETLGSQDSGLSFGNLAHSTQAQQQKPAFGGSSFMNYRS